MQRLATIVAALAALLAGNARAQDVPHRVRLRDPSCTELPFAASRLRDLLELELSADGAELVDPDEPAEAEVSYEPEPCEPGATRFVLRLTGEGGVLRLSIADMGEIPLATVPRALALEVVEALRGHARPLAEAPPIEPAPPPLEPPSPPPQAEVPLEPARGSGVPARLGAAAGVRNTPDTGGTLASLRVLLDLPLGQDLPLAVRIDLAAAFGPSAHDLVLGSMGGGLSLFVWARALPALALRFGPRLFVAHGWAFGADTAGAQRQSEDVQVGAGLVVGADVALAPGVELLFEVEVGTHLLGLEYAVAAGRSGFLGAYWGGDLALAFAL